MEAKAWTKVGEGDSPWLDGRQTWALVVMLVVALLVRVAWWLAYMSVIENEGAEYATLAINLARGVGYVGILGGEHTLFPPLYPGLIAVAFSALGVEPEAAGRAISLIAGVGLVAALYGITLEMFGRAAAYVAGAMAALHPMLVALSTVVYSESLALAFIAAGVYATIIVMKRRSARVAVCAGAAFGAAYLVRPEGLVFSFAAAGFVLLCGLGAPGWKARLAPPLAIIAAAAAFALPYVGYLSAKAGALHLEGKSHIINSINARLRAGMNFEEANRGLGPNMELEGVYLVPDQFELMRRSTTTSLDTVRALFHDPIGKIERLLRELRWSAALGFPLMGLLVGAGFVLSVWWKDRRAVGLLLLAVACVQVLMLLTLEFRFQRYTFPLLLMLFPWAAIGLVCIARIVARVVRSFASSVPAGVIGALPSGALMALMLREALGGTLALAELGDVDRQHLKTTGAWIRSQVGEGARVATYSSVIPYYARGTLHYLPYAPEELGLKYLRTIRPDFVVISSADLRRTPYNQAWFDDGIPDACAQPATEVRGADETVVKVWRWTCPAAGESG